MTAPRRVGLPPAHRRRRGGARRIARRRVRRHRRRGERRQRALRQQHDDDERRAAATADVTVVSFADTPSGMRRRGGLGERPASTSPTSSRRRRRTRPARSRPGTLRPSRPSATTAPSEPPESTDLGVFAGILGDLRPAFHAAARAEARVLAGFADPRGAHHLPRLVGRGAPPPRPADGSLRARRPLGRRAGVVVGGLRHARFRRRLARAPRREAPTPARLGAAARRPPGPAVTR